MNLNLLVFLAIVGIAIALKVGWRPSRPKMHWGWIAGAAVLALMLLGVSSCVSSRRAELASVEAPTAPAERLWAFKTLDIPPEGLPVFIYRGARGWPKGGAITVSTKEGRLLLRDEPGVTNKWDFPDGLYIVRADPIGSTRQIQLHNRW